MIARFRLNCHEFVQMTGLQDSLEPGGVMIASIYTARVRRNALQIWRMIEDIGEVIDSTTMVNRETWTVKVFQPTKIDTAVIGR